MKYYDNSKIEVRCPFCDYPAEWVSNEKVYGKRYGKSYMCWYCKDCDAYVGCHQNTMHPLGTMANKELRSWRRKVHEIIDPLWQKEGLNRKTVYQRLRVIFGREFHTGSATLEDCKFIVDNQELLKMSVSQLKNKVNL